MVVSLNSIGGKIKAAQRMISDAQRDLYPWTNSTTAMCLLEYVKESFDSTDKQKKKARELWCIANDIFTSWKVDHRHDDDLPGGMFRMLYGNFVHSVHDVEQLFSDEYTEQCRKIKMQAIIDLATVRAERELCGGTE